MGLSYFSDDKGEVISEAFGQADCFLLGRRTYEIFAASWPNFPDKDNPVASRLNTLPKYVVSTTLANTEWQPTTVIRGDVAAEVAKLKDRHEGEIQVHGSAALAQTLHARGLIDEYRIFIEPVVLGTGKRLFEPGSTPTALQLVETKPMDKGSVLAIYRPAGKPTHGEFQMEEGFGLPRPGGVPGFRTSARGVSGWLCRIQLSWIKTAPGRGGGRSVGRVEAGGPRQLAPRAERRGSSQEPARVNVRCVTPLGEEVASTS